MKIKAIQDVRVDDRLYHAGDIVVGLTGKDLEQALVDGLVVVIKAKKVKNGNRKNS